MTTEASVQAFFSSPQFAVLGASSNPAKFGHKSEKGRFFHSLLTDCFTFVAFRSMFIMRHMSGSVTSRPSSQHLHNFRHIQLPPLSLPIKYASLKPVPSQLTTFISSTGLVPGAQTPRNADQPGLGVHHDVIWRVPGREVCLGPTGAN